MVDLNVMKLRQLHIEQKQFLFKKQYIDAKSLDTDVEPNWQQYYVNCFNWLIDTEGNNGWYNLVLIAKDNSRVSYRLNLNLKKDFDKLMEI